jgi:peptidyl-prolyl cis-trans isomerase SurA
MKIIQLVLSLLLVLPQISAYSKVVDKVVAIIGDKVITNYEIEMFNPPEIKKIYSNTDENKKATLIKKYYKDVLDFLIDQYVVEIAAAKEGVKVTDKDIDAAVGAVLKENKITLDQLIEILSEKNIPLNQYKWQLKVELLNKKIRSQILSPLMVVADEDIQDYINEHKGTLNLEDRYELRTILVDNKADYNNVMNYLKNKGSFADAAIKFSKDPTGKSGGYLGWVNNKDLSEKIRAHLNGKDAGETFFVNDSGKFRIFLVEAYQNKGEVGSDTKDKIVDKIREEKYSDLYKNWLDRHKSNIFVKYVE